jgi:hypothetical protein
MRFKALNLLIIVVALFVLNACSSNSQNPVNPTVQPATVAQTAADGSQPGHYLLGYLAGTIDPTNGTYELEPVRLADIHLNILKFLDFGPCTTCFKITNIQVLPNHDISVDFTLTHPFPTQYTDLTIFDTRGIIMFDGDESFPEFGKDVPQISQGNPILSNADGFTSLFNPSTEGNGFFGYLKGKIAPDGAPPTANLNGYKVYYNSTNRRYLLAGTVETATYLVKPPTSGTFTFGYAVDCSWDIPTQPIVVPNSFPITANCLEAYKIETSLNHGLATALNATATLTVDVYDWQGAATILAVDVEGPYFWTGIKSGAAVAGGPGDKRFEVELINANNVVPAGDYPILIRVTDTESHPGELIDNIAYQLINVPVNINNSPVCSASVDKPEPGTGETVTFTDTSTDLDGATDIVESWWDWENDGVWDEEGSVVGHSFSANGIVYVNHKVKDAAGAEASLSDPMEFDIGMYITLPEDFDYKQPGMAFQYEALDTNYNSGAVINLDDTNGPWDFTTIGLNTEDDWRRIIDVTDPEVAGFVGNFNSNTTHFVKFENIFDPLFSLLYQAEFHYFTGNLLYNYGFYEPTIVGSAAFNPPADTLAVPYPLSISTNYSFIKDNPGFYLDYTVKAIGRGNVTVPYGSGTTYDCLLVRYRFSVTADPPLQGGFLNFTFITDDGLVVAQVIAINMPPTYNWNTSMNSIYPDGDASFQALHDFTQ